MNVFRIDSQLEPGSRIAAGTSLGATSLSIALRQLHSSPNDKRLVVSFEGVEFTTSSFIKSLLLPSAFSAALENESLTEVCPVVIGANHEVIDTIATVFKANQAAVLAARTNAKVPLTYLGYLDPALTETFNLLYSREEATAGALEKERKALGGPSSSGWSNRLADLWAARLGSRTRRGKEWIYKQVKLEE
jgi:hypothetical protein